MRHLALATAFALGAHAADAESVAYTVDGEAFEGHFARAEGAPKGLVLIVHDWDGLGDYEARRAEMLAELGYDAFALDLFGAGNRPDTVDGRRAATGALYENRERMRALLTGGLAEAQRLSEATETVAMGYCFGGAATLELARSGMGEGVVGYASFHGGLGTPEGQSWSADSPPVLILQGGADTNPSMADVAAFSQELEAAGVRYDIEVYSGAPHAFTVFGSDRYRERADMLSWAAFTGFLEERLVD